MQTSEAVSEKNLEEVSRAQSYCKAAVSFKGMNNMGFINTL
jgi:hypothetical protein